MHEEPDFILNLKIRFKKRRAEGHPPLGALLQVAFGVVSLAEKIVNTDMVIICKQNQQIIGPLLHSCLGACRRIKFLRQASFRAQTGNTNSACVEKFCFREQQS